ncbi:MAG: histone deacetylase [Chloroflexi bacterium]|nr:histone deacetylase [Chloroflexota bacterium]
MKAGMVCHPVYLEHDTGQHPENASRLEHILALLEQSGVKEELVQIPAQPASMDDLLAVHSAAHISQIEAAARAGGGWLDADTVVSSRSYEAALHAAGGVLQAAETVLRGDVRSAFALVRPPGHHATGSDAGGFCLFNNIAVAARQAVRKHGLSRVLIADFDVHHGNGTQDIFYDDPSVFFFSVHQWPLYPGTGRITETGTGKGAGTTANVPLPPGCGDESYLEVFQQVLLPLAQRFRPELILVSAGYDAHWADSISYMQLTVSGFARMVSLLKKLAADLCQDRLVLTLEGGYHLRALPYSVKATFDVLLGKTEIEDPLGQPAGGTREPDTGAVIQQVRQAHKL